MYRNPAAPTELPALPGGRYPLHVSVAQGGRLVSVDTRLDGGTDGIALYKLQNGSWQLASSSTSYIGRMFLETDTAYVALGTRPPQSPDLAPLLLTMKRAVHLPSDSVNADYFTSQRLAGASQWTPDLLRVSPHGAWGWLQAQYSAPETCGDGRRVNAAGTLEKLVYLPSGAVSTYGQVQDDPCAGTGALSIVTGLDFLAWSHNGAELAGADIASRWTALAHSSLGSNGTTQQIGSSTASLGNVGVTYYTADDFFLSGQEYSADFSVCYTTVRRVSDLTLLHQQTNCATPINGVPIAPDVKHMVASSPGPLFRQTTKASSDPRLTQLRRQSNSQRRVQVN